MRKALRMKPERLDSRLQRTVYKNGEEFFVDHPLCYDQIIGADPYKESWRNAFLNLKYRENRKPYTSYLRKKDYHSALVPLTKKHKMPWFIKFHQKIFTQYGESKYYELLGEMLTYVDHHKPFRTAYQKLLTMGSNTISMMSPKEQRLFSLLPDSFIIYRGVCVKKPITTITEKDRNVLVGHSWTLKKKIASRFATYHGPKFTPQPYTRAILSYHIQKRDTIAYFIGRKEHEIFIDPQKIDLSKIKIQVLPNEGIR